MSAYSMTTALAMSLGLLFGTHWILRYCENTDFNCSGVAFPDLESPPGKFSRVRYYVSCLLTLFFILNIITL